MLSADIKKYPLNTKSVILISVIWYYDFMSGLQGKSFTHFKTAYKSTGVVPCLANSQWSQQQTDEQLGIWLWPYCRIAKRSPSILHHLPFLRLLLSYKWLIFFGSSNAWNWLSGVTECLTLTRGQMSSHARMHSLVSKWLGKFTS